MKRFDSSSFARRICQTAILQCSFRSFLIAGLLAAAVLVLGASPAACQDINCTFSMSNINFGSIDVSSGKPFEATGTFTYACTGDSREMVRICPSWDIGDVGQMDDGAGHKLKFNLYSDESHATVWSTWFGKVKGPTIDVPIGRSEKSSGSATVFGQVSPGQQGLPPGNYKASVGGGHVSIDYDSANRGSCDAIKHSQRISRVSFTITATVTPPAGGAPDSSAGGPASGSPTAQLKRGMKMEEVTRLLGTGKQLSESVGDNGLKTQVFEYVTTERRVEITYVDGLVVRYSISSK
jgi:spore coat protein U-like protein